MRQAICHCLITLLVATVFVAMLGVLTDWHCYLLGAECATPIESSGGHVIPEFAKDVRVHIDGEPLSLAEALRRASADRTLVTYRQLRSLHGGTVSGQRNLALWCRKQGLSDEERLHWRVLLYATPNHPEAVEALRLREYHGRFVTSEELEEIRKAKKAANQAKRHWTPKLKRIKQSIKQGDAAERETALRELQAIRDPLAAPLVMELFSGENAELGMLAVEIIARISNRKATDTLVRLATNAAHAEVRLKAASELKYRPTNSYVPSLMAQLATPIELSSHMSMEPGGPSFEPYSVVARTGRFAVGLYNKARLSGNYGIDDVMFWGLEGVRVSGVKLSGYRPDHMKYEYVLSRESPDPDMPFRFIGVIEGHSAPRSGERGSEPLRRSVAALKEKIREANAKAAQLNQRIDEVLRDVTGVDVHKGRGFENREEADVNPRLWWDWWKRKVEPNCYFAEDTEVWTQLGPIPIENILVGDRVLTRDPDTERLAFKMVIGFDMQPQDVVHMIEVGSRTIVATPEQLVFVTGEGWRKVSELRKEMQLDSLVGPKRIEHVRLGAADSTYSLLIADVSNYFVDRQGILVHDARRR